MQVGNATEIGKAIRRARQAAGLTQTALARRCGTTQRWLSELENGKPRAELELALRVMRELGFALHVDSGSDQGDSTHRDTFDPADLVGMTRRSPDE